MIRGVIAEKDSADLFTIDTAGDAEIGKQNLKSSKPLRADEIVAKRSAVPAVSLRKRPGDKTTDGVIERKRQRVSYVSHKELTRLQNIADGRYESQSIVNVMDPAYDPWDEKQNKLDQVGDPKFSFLPKAEKKKAPKTLRHKPISLAASGKSIPAVQRPDGGYSYNPLYEEYSDRLLTAGEREVKAEKKRLAQAEAVRLKQEAAARSAAEAETAELRAELSEWDEESAWEGFESGGEDVKLNAKRPKPKTPQQRTKIRRRREEELKAKMAVDIKKKHEQAAQANKIAKALTEKQNDRAIVASNDNDSSSEGDDLELRRRKLGKIPLPEKQLELVLPDELQESLRLLKPEGNLLKDRYRSLLVRGKLENRRPISFAKKARRKVTEKWTHKDFMLH
jgi:nucleolar protein 53